MKILVAFILSMTAFAHAASTIKSAELACEWSGFDLATEKFDSRKFPIILSQSEEGDQMVFNTVLTKLGSDEMEIQILPQASDFTMDSSVSLEVVINRPGVRYPVLLSSIFSSLKEKTMGMTSQAGSLVSQLSCTVGKITK